tara:strand:- start:1213 stop:1872 length:660 start_codon:yes stop_codon:yes gene_type:complete
MSKSQPKSDRGEFNDLGQPVGTPKGEPNPDAISAPALVEKDPTTPVELAPAPKVAEAPAGGSIFSADQRDELLKLIRTDPVISKALLQSVTQTPEGRSLLNIQPGQGAPVGHYSRNYENEPHLAVTGGREVSHPQGFRPNPPSYIKKFVAPGGNRTDHEKEAQYDANEEPILTEDYKHWLDMKHAGKHLDGKVMSDMSVGAFGQSTGEQFAAADGFMEE